VAGGLGAHWGGVWERNVLNFQVKMHFYCEKLYMWPETKTRGGLFLGDDVK